MGKNYLLDTNAISKSLRGLFPVKGLVLMQQALAESPRISVITRIELLGWQPADPSFGADLVQIVEASTVYPLSEEVVRQTIQLRRKMRIKLPDAVIAATALVHRLTLLSDNDADFLAVPKLKYINPAKLVDQAV